MSESKASMTALISAYVRAYHAKNDIPKIFDDFLAEKLFSHEEYDFIGRNLAKSLMFFDPEQAKTCPDQDSALASVIRAQSGPITLSRARYTEDCLKAAVKEGVQQYVILGAGMDTFAFREPSLMQQLEVFELDHPATQEAKRQRIDKQGWSYTEKLHFVPVDFTKDSLIRVLENSLYDTGKKSLFSWLGVTYYLTQEVVYDTLRAITEIAPRGSTVIFDYLDADAFIPEKAAPKARLMQEIVRNVGEPMKAGFDPLLLASQLEGLGMYMQENLRPSDIEEKYFLERNDGYHAFPHVHFAKAIVT